MNWFRSFWKGLAAPSARGEQIAPEYPHCFTPRAQQALAFARQEADRFNHNFVGTEHLLLGLIKLGQGVAVNVLRKLGLDLETVRMAVEKAVGTGPDQKMIGNIPYTPRVKKVLALAAKEAKNLNHTYVGTEHILLGLLREGDGVAARVLKGLDVDIEQTRQVILKELDPNFGMEAKRFEIGPNADSPKRPFDPIDTSKRYDIYCVDWNQQAVVYRNALFKGRRSLLNTRPMGIGSEFLEVEQSNGQTVFLSSHSVRKFCEHGAEIAGEIIPPQ